MKFRLKRFACALGMLLLAGGSAIAIGILTPRQWGTVSHEPCAVTIYISGDNFHTNLILPLQADTVDWRQRLNLETLEPPLHNDDRWLSVGWGDRAFYINTPSLEDLRLSTTLRALLWPTDTTLLIQGRRALPNHYQVKPVTVSRSAYLRLTQFILSSFARDAKGQPIFLQASQRYDGSFYAANGRYFLFNTCNDWTARGLRIANTNTPLWSGLALSVFHHAKSSCKPPTP